MSYDIKNCRNKTTHKCEYTPGTRALVTDSGIGFDHLSGFHSYASGPHNSGLRLVPRMDTVTIVPLGIGMESISLPLVPLIGNERGNTMSRVVLYQVRKAFTKIFRSDYLPSEERCYWWVAGGRRQST